MSRAAFIAMMLAGGIAGAYPTGTQFDDPAIDDGDAQTAPEPGGGGIAFDGAPRWAGRTCAVCHTGAPGRVSLRLEADKPELFTDGWLPGQRYHLRVVLDDTWANEANRALGDNCGPGVEPYRACDSNGFALELADRTGHALGRLTAFAGTACAAPGVEPVGADAHILHDGLAAVHNGARHGQTTWDLCWTAPNAGAGTVTAYLSAVDGNGGDGTAAFPQDTTGDDVASGAVPIAEHGGAQEVQVGGCASTDGAGLGALVLVVLLCALRRRRLLALALAALAGCTHVQAHQRATLSRRNMQFAPDPAEDELDLHMQNSREGSSGGYGSSGGGCGCN